MAQVGGVVAVVVASFAPIHFHDPPGHPIEHVAVVGHQHQGPLETAQIALQPLDAIGIEVVGGLIQQQHIRIGHQGGRQGHPLAVSPGEFAHLALAIGDSQPLQHLLALALQIPGIEAIHPALQIAELGQQGAVVGVGGDRLAQPQVLAQQGHLFATAGEHLLQHGVLRIHGGFLVHQHHPGPFRAAALAFTERLYPSQHLEQGRFAGAIGANQPQAIPLTDVQVEAGKQGADAEILARPHQADQAQRPSWRCCSK